MTLSPTRSPCGGLYVWIAGERCLLRCSGAMHVVDHDVLIVADMHLEKGSAFAVRGQMLPPYDSAATLLRLQQEIVAINPKHVVLLGDSFHDRAAIGRMVPTDHERLERMAAGRDWLWLEGNHDRDALLAFQLASGSGHDRPALPGTVIETMAIGGLRLVHEPQPGDQPGEVAGHLHPCGCVVAHRRKVRRSCFITDGSRIVLPAFGAFTGGLNVRDPAIADLFETPPLAVLLGPETVSPIKWAALC